LIDEHQAYLRDRLAEGYTNQSQLWREFCQQRFTRDRELVSKGIRENGMTPRAKSTNPAIEEVTIVVP
jgi:hypothetical protein